MDSQNMPRLYFPPHKHTYETLQGSEWWGELQTDQQKMQNRFSEIIFGLK
jgi:hypothetical protein